MILGIESSCDDTGSAIVDAAGNLFGDTLHSQQDVHLRYSQNVQQNSSMEYVILINLTHYRHGGIIAPLAANLHRQNIEKNVFETLAKAKMTMHEIDAIAVSNRPGLKLSLTVGVRYAKHLSRQFGKPIIPIHHMQAHAITVRMQEKVDYPFLCLLASGGHCLLTFVRNTSDFSILGQMRDIAPGQCLDAVARTMQLQSLPQFARSSGGAAIETAASQAKDPNSFEFKLPMLKERNCEFSFTGLEAKAEGYVKVACAQHGLPPGQVMPHYEDLCAGLLRSLTEHIAQRTQRAMQFCDMNGWWEGSDGRRLVISGGVASNNFLYTALGQLAEQFGYTIHRPSRRLCTDNGIMIAWNGVERWLLERKKYVNLDIDDIDICTKEAIGTDFRKDLEAAKIKYKWAKLPILRS